MKMTRDRCALGKYVNIQVDEAEIIQLHEAGLLRDLSTRGGDHVGVARFDMAARLQPPGQLSMVDQGHLWTRWMEHEG